MCSALVWDCYAEMSSVSTSNSLAANKHHATTSLLNLLLKYRVWFANSNVFKASKLPGRLWKVNWVSGGTCRKTFSEAKGSSSVSSTSDERLWGCWAFCIERGYVLTFDEESLLVFSQCKGCNLLWENRQGKVRNREQSGVQLPLRRTFPGNKLQWVW